MTEADERIARLLEAAHGARAAAYAPYSNFLVGAALLASNGRIFTGCNVENASYGLTSCAERNAVFGAVAAGCRDFTHLIISTDLSGPTPPCGACRQVLNEFAPALWIGLASPWGLLENHTLSDLLPKAFGPWNLRK